MKTLTIISGGQTGADRAALEFAIRQGIAHSGWCPRERRAEDGPLAEKFLLTETPSRKYSQRTKWNVRDADVTVLLTTRSGLRGGTALTARTAEQQGKPWLHLCREETSSVEEAGDQLRAFVQHHEAQHINIAGPRQSQDIEVGFFVEAVLTAAFGP